MAVAVELGKELSRYDWASLRAASTWTHQPEPRRLSTLFSRALIAMSSWATALSVSGPRKRIVRAKLPSLFSTIPGPIKAAQGKWREPGVFMWILAAVFTFDLVFVGGLVYLLPSIIAFQRRLQRRRSLLVTNILLGITVIGWVGCLFWSLTA